jgi:hypothetical protein
MSHIMRRTAGTSTIGVTTVSIVLMALLASISSLNIPSFGQEQNNDGDDDDGTSLFLSGRIRG